MPESSANNPLSAYFRQPAIFVRLPSDGKFYPNGTLDMPPNREIPVYPMTAVDEITYRTPDALYNGAATVAVIQSCVPAIKDAWAMPSVDLDMLLVAIRIASFGHQMEMTLTCPHCTEENDYGVDLRSIIDNLRSPDYKASVAVGDLELYFRPLDYRQVQEINNLQFEQQRIISLLPGSELTEQEKLGRLNESMRELTDLTTRSLARTIAMVKTPQAQVTDHEHIRDWLSNCDRDVYNRVRDHALELRKSSELQPLRVPCRACSKEFDQPFTLDQASFFGNAS